MTSNEVRVLGRVLAQQQMTDQEIAMVYGGEEFHDMMGYGSDSLCHIIYGDGGRPAGGEVDDCKAE